MGDHWKTPPQIKIAAPRRGLVPTISGDISAVPCIAHWVVRQTNTT